MSKIFQNTAPLFVGSCIVLLTFSPGFSVASPPASHEAYIYYVDDGHHLVQVHSEHPPAVLQASRWEIRLFMRGASTRGRYWWGLITGPSYESVIQQLRREQEFQRTYLTWTGYYLNEDFTYLNFLGPIAVLNTESRSDQVEIKQNIDKRLRSYADQLDDLFAAYESLRQELAKDPSKKISWRRLRGDTLACLYYMYVSLLELRRSKERLAKASTRERVPEIPEQIDAFFTHSRSCIGEFQHAVAFVKRKMEGGNYPWHTARVLSGMVGLPPTRRNLT